MKFQKLCSLTASAVLVIAALPFPLQYVSAAEINSDDIVILYTNDVHSYADQGIGYDGVKLCKREMEAQYSHVFLVDAGDSIQGTPLAKMTQGKDVVELMNAVGYDICIPGNHEFDYGMEVLHEREKELTCGYTCCNLIDLEENATVFTPYRMMQAGDVKIAFVGVTTPGTVTSVTPTTFRNTEGEYIYSFSAEEGSKFYDTIQNSVDAARKADADYVILVGHLGEKNSVPEWTAEEVVKQTTGIDAVIDAHSHEEIPGMTVKARDGREITITQTGTRLANIGRVVIREDGTITTELLDSVPEPDEALGFEASSYQENPNKAGSFADTAVHEKMSQIYNTLDDVLSEKIGVSPYELRMRDPETNARVIRMGETNLGDFITDALRSAVKTDIAILNAGAVRDAVFPGDITLKTTAAAFPYEDYLFAAELTGQQILDILEKGAVKYPKEDSSLMQVSGLTYAIDPEIESTYTTDKEGHFTGVSGQRRVHSVMVGTEPLDPEKTYTVATVHYLLKEGGDDYIATGNCKVLLDTLTEYSDVAAEYIRNDLKGVIPDYYSDPAGRGRIRFSSEPVNWMQYPESLATLAQMQQWTGFDPSMLPEGFDPSMLPEGFDPTKLPPDFDLTRADFSRLPEDFDWKNIPEDFDWSTLLLTDEEMEEIMRQMILEMLMENMDPEMLADFDPDSLDLSRLPEDFDWNDIPEDFDWSILFAPPAVQYDTGNLWGERPDYMTVLRSFNPRTPMEPTPMKEIPPNSYPAYITSISDTPVVTSGAGSVSHSPYTADKHPAGLLAFLTGLALTAMTALRRHR